MPHEVAAQLLLELLPEQAAAEAVAGEGPLLDPLEHFAPDLHARVTRHLDVGARAALYLHAEGHEGACRDQPDRHDDPDPPPALAAGSLLAQREQAAQQDELHGK